MSKSPSPLRTHAPWVAGASLLALSLLAGGWALASRSFDPSALLGSIQGARGARTPVAVGAVANAAGVGGDAALAAARQGIDDALAARATVSRVGLAEPASRGARAVSRGGGHVLDANVLRVVRGPGRVLVEASVVVSSTPGRAYEFASASTIILTGDVADTDEGLRDAVRRAMRSATTHAVDQMTRP